MVLEQDLVEVDLDLVEEEVRQDSEVVDLALVEGEEQEQEEELVTLE